MDGWEVDRCQIRICGINSGFALILMLDVVEATATSSELRFQ
jgi:hypothetical protein